MQTIIDLSGILEEQTFSQASVGKDLTMTQASYVRSNILHLNMVADQLGSRHCCCHGIHLCLWILLALLLP